jgi:MtN3 and saliva related transmembrane protein
MEAELVGSLAAALTTVSFLPQAVRVIRTNDTAAISLWMYVLFTIGLVCWEVYGWMIGSKPVIVANLITLALAFVILAQKVRHVLVQRPQG